MNFVYEAFIEKFRVIGYFLGNNAAKFEIHIVTDKVFDTDFELLRLNKLFERYMEFSCYGNLSNILVLKKNYDSDYVFISKKKFDL